MSESSEDASSLSTIDLAAVTSTTTATSTAASSSLRSPSSRAASTSSFAITNDTETERSDDIADIDAVAIKAARHALSASKLLVPRLAQAAEQTQQIKQTQQTKQTKHPSLSAPPSLISNTALLRASSKYLAFDVPVYDSKLYCLELLLSSSSSSADKKRNNCGNQIQKGFHHVSGVSIGCCLGSVVELLRNSSPKGQPATIVQSLQITLTACAVQLRMARGVDVDVLKAGMAAGHVARSQLLQISNKRVIGRLHSRHGNASTVMGCTVTLIAISSYLIKRHFNYKQIQNQIFKMVRDVDLGLHEFVVRCGGNAMSNWEIDAVQAEQRAIQRARCGIVSAECVATAEGLSDRDRLFLSVAWMAKAAFPPGECLDLENHECLLRTLTSSIFYLQPVLAAPIAQCIETNKDAQIVPLSEIQHSLCSPRIWYDNDHSSATTWSSRSSSAPSVSFSMLSEDSVGEMSCYHDHSTRPEGSFAGLEISFCQLLFS